MVNSGGLRASSLARAGVSVLCLTALYHFGMRMWFLLSTSLASNFVRSEVGSLKTPSRTRNLHWHDSFGALSAGHVLSNSICAVVECGSPTLMGFRFEKDFL